jgi:dCMP deaminase
VKWHNRFLQIAKTVATWSKDPASQVGAVAVSDARAILTTGYNGIPRHVADFPERYQRPEKYRFVCHAEQNLVAHAARSVLDGATIYVTHAPCCDCAKLLINAGVRRIYFGAGQTSMDPAMFEAARVMCHDAGVELVQIEVPDEPAH